MGFSYREVLRLTFGRWADLFDTYKKIHNLTVSGSQFKIEKNESIFEGMGDDDWEEVTDTEYAGGETTWQVKDKLAR